MPTPPATDQLSSSSDIFEHILGGSPQTPTQNQPIPQQSKDTKEKIEQKKAEDQAYASERYLKLQEEIRALQYKREEDDRKRLEAMDEEKKQNDVEKQQLQSTSFPLSPLQTYRAENKAGKARE
ncbi:MAG: hypothetical protein Q8R11_03205 [bacterium]|nr:hypothetical protein [bacterium]